MRIFTVENFYIVEKLLKSDKQCKFATDLCYDCLSANLWADLPDWMGEENIF